MNIGTDRVRTLINVERYQKMVAAGVLTKYDRVELIEGEMFAMAPTGASHAAVSMKLTQLFVLGVGNAARVSVGGPVSLGGFSEPQPDVLLLRPRDDYFVRIPDAGDVLLAVEISGSSLAYDRTTKSALYAKYGIAEYWIVDVAGESVELHSDPVSGCYIEKRVSSGTEEIAPRAVPALRVTVRELFV